MGKKHPNITNISELEPRVEQRGTKFGYKAKRLGMPSGAKALGCSWFEVQPGQTAFPNHFHSANEESIFILEGTGEARIGKEKVHVEKGDYIAFPVGPEFSHSLKNNGTKALQYLCFSTMIPTEVVGYPDSKKIGAVGTSDFSKGMAGAWIRILTHEQPPVDYYAGEDVG